MKHRLASSPRTLSPRAATFALVAALGASAPLLTPPLHAAPKKPQNELQIWPGRRVIMVLPIALSPTWNADAQLGRAIIPLAQPQLQQALYDTGKFSTTLPYRFDPILRRGATENQIAEEDITALLADPSLTTSQAVVDKLTFDQPVMTTEILLEELTVGGTPKMPTVQIRASGKLFEQGNPDAIKTVSIRSDAMPGKTPGDRLTAATAQVFREIAASFVEPPVAFDLPLPVALKSQKGKSASSGTSSSTTGGNPGSASNGNADGGAATGATTDNAAPSSTTAESTTAPITSAPLSTVASPQTLPGGAGAPFVPQLPAASPPLGVTAGEGTTIGR